MQERERERAKGRRTRRTKNGPRYLTFFVVFWGRTDLDAYTYECVPCTSTLLDLTTPGTRMTSPQHLSFDICIYSVCVCVSISCLYHVRPAASFLSWLYVSLSLSLSFSGFLERFFIQSYFVRTLFQKVCESRYNYFLTDLPCLTDWRWRWTQLPARKKLLLFSDENQQTRTNY